MLPQVKSNQVKDANIIFIPNRYISFKIHSPSHSVNAESRDKEEISRSEARLDNDVTWQSPARFDVLG